MFVSTNQGRQTIASLAIDVIISDQMMLHIWKSLLAWCQAHSLSVTVALFFVGCFVSIFSKDIRDFSKIPPQAVGKWIRQARLQWLERRLFIMTRGKDVPLFVIQISLEILLRAVAALLIFSVIIVNRVFNTPLPASQWLSRAIGAILSIFLGYTTGLVSAGIRVIADVSSSAKRGCKIQHEIDEIRAKLLIEEKTEGRIAITSRG